MNEQLQAVFTLNDSAFARGADRILAQLNRIEQKSDSTSRALESGFNSPLGSIGKFAAGVFTIDKALDLLKQGLKITSDIQRLDAGLSNVSSSSLDFARSQAYLRKLSDELGLSIEELQSSYKSLKAATNGTNLEGAKTEKIFTAVVHAGAALKLSNEDIKGSLLALTQMLSKGTVSMEELRGQLAERVPAAFQLAAKAMNVSQAQLVKMISDGKVLAEDLLPKLADELEKTYGSKAQSNVDSIAGGWQRATDQMKLFIAEFSETNGIDTFFAKLFNGVGDYLKLIRQAQDQTGSMFGTVKNYTPGFQKDLNTFNSFDTKRKESFLNKFRAGIEMKEREADTVTGFTPTEQNLAWEKSLRADLAAMKERYQIYRRALREENRKIDEEANRPKVANLAAEKDSKGRTYWSPLEIAERNKKGLEDSIAAQRGTFNGVDPDLLKQLEAAEKTIRILRGEAEKTAPFLKTTGNSLSEIFSSIVAPLQQTKGLLDRFNEGNNWKSIRFLQDEIEKIRYHADAIAVNALNKNLKLDPEALQQLREYVALLTKADISRRNMDRQVAAEQGRAQVNAIKNTPNGQKWNSIGGIANEFTDSALAAFQKNRDEVIGNAKDMADTLVSTLNQGAASATQAMGNFVDGLIAGTAGIDQLPGAVLGVVADMLQSLAKALAISGALLLLVNPGMGVMQLGASVGLYAASAGLNAAAKPKRRAMAKGGTLSGPTEITAGEYPGANQRGKEEWVSPVDVGAGLIAEKLMELGGFGGGGRLVTEIHGSTLRIILERDEKLRRATGRG
ncbi:tape measure protein [Spirosoma sp. KNUC1025]|uniref:tape measure protein n=1 Tax=Spirosoma sp. KNUC1025 TaxID=2894082 RepID=UPI00386CBFD6|nr:tape measure protein [Spirosoma sp. KNUC1025]